MCDLRNIQKIFRGTTPVQRVCVGNRVIWPVEQYTYELTDIGFAYSGGGILNVMATNYAYIYATLITKNRGTIIDRKAIRMTPNYRSETGHPNYYSTVNDEIRFDIDKYGKTEITGGTRSAHFYGTYEDPSHKVWTSDDFLVQLTENNKTLVIIESETAVSITTSSPVSCTTNKVVAYIHPTRKYYYQFDSGLDTKDNPQIDNSGTAKLYINDTFYKEVSGTSENWKIDNIDIGYNKHTSSAKNITFKVEYYGKSGSVTLTQSGDSVYYVDENPRDWNVYLSQNTDSISPAGGSAYYYVDAYHYVDAQGYWSSDDTPTGDPCRAERTDAVALVSVSGASDRYSYDLSNGILTVSHANMGTRDVSADKVTFTFANANHASTTTSKTWDPQNTHTEARVDQRGTRTYGTSKQEYRSYTASISASSYSSESSKCPASGGGTTLFISGSHQERTAKPWTQPVYAYIRYYNYASGADERTERHSELDYTDSGTEYTSWSTKTDSLTPTMSAPDGGFTRNGTVVTIASEGKTVYKNGRTATFTVKNNTATQSVTIYQQYNVKTTTAAHYGNTVGITMGLSRDYLDCTGGSVTVSGTRQREWYSEKNAWTSGESEGGEMSYKYESITSWTSITVSPTATVSGTTITIGERKHNTSSQVFTVTGKADGKTATATVERLGDSTYPGTKYTRSHYLQVEGALNTISASGGSRKYDISAGHTLVTPTYWRSDDELYSEVTEQVRDKWKYTKSGAGQSYYKNFNVTAGTESSADYLSFDHDNMAKRVETDTISISIVSAFDSTQTFAETLAPANKVETSTPETTTAFVLNAISKVTSSGATIQIAGTRTYKTAYKKWTSLAEEGGETKTEQNRNADSIQIVDATTHTWAHADTGGKLRIDATTWDTDRTVQFKATYGGFTTSSITVTQWRNDYYTYEYSLEKFGLRASSIEWDSTSSTGVYFTVYRKATLHHDGGSTPGTWTTSPDTHSIFLTGNTTHFSLFNNTHGTRGASIDAKSGEDIYVDVVGRNTGQSDIITTVNNNVADDKATYTHKHRDLSDVVTIENKSTYNLMIRWEERSSSEITIPAGETGYLLSRRDERIEFKVASGSANIVVKSSGETIGSGTVTTDWTNIGVEGGELDNWYMTITNS